MFFHIRGQNSWPIIITLGEGPVHHYDSGRVWLRGCFPFCSAILRSERPLDSYSARSSRTTQWRRSADLHYHIIFMNLYRTILRKTFRPSFFCSTWVSNVTIFKQEELTFIAPGWSVFPLGKAFWAWSKLIAIFLTNFIHLKGSERTFPRQGK